MVLVAFIVLVAVLMTWDWLLVEKIRRWDFLPIGDLDEKGSPSAELACLRVVVVTPARNEADLVPLTVPALYHQDFPGRIDIHLVDDHSSDRTAEAARAAVEFFEHKNRSLTVIPGGALPDGWVGKVWAMHQALRNIGADREHWPDYVLLTDADIWHRMGSVSRLVAESRSAGLALNSRMALLRCESFWEKLLIPAFVFFFNLLYPMRRINNPGDPFAGAAGGCVLLSQSALVKLGWSLESIKSCLIDDVNLARQVKAQGLPINLSLSGHEVISERPYGTLGEIWRMVRRSAYTELKHNPPRLAVALAGLFATFMLPALMVTHLFAAPLTVTSYAAGVCGALILLVQFFVYRPAVRFFNLGFFWSFTLPVAGILYGLMTLDSARLHYFSRENAWRGKRDRS
ncbi:MAG: glycosyltransferase [Verrucomicrobiales bacterium]|jgi:hopene-associated glycosyltransferase HpnB|nr:glycosyltransferase [Verrucomicrobiales bacterium]